MKRMKHLLPVVFTLFFSMIGLASAVQSERTEPDKKPTNKLYIVRMADAPVVAYKGEVAGLKATKPAKGKKIDPNSTEVVQYAAYLDTRHDAALGKTGGRKVYGYKYSFNGFAAELTAEQADKMKNVAGVLAVDKDEVLTLDTSSTPSFLGIDAPGGLWSQAGGVGSAGENIIIGIVDGGVWPEHPSFSDRTGVNGNFSKDGKLGYQQIPGWHGKCTPGEAFTGTDCNQKLIGAQYYNAGWGGNDGIDKDLPWEFNSPRDFGGHGSHTASTAGGNNGVAATGVHSVFGKISGIAPRARIAAYKVCWQTATGGSCFTTDSVAAIDQAVADGVDVINFSISGSRTSFRDPVEIAFLFAADAGVFVAASAGNSGPVTSTVAHPGPWLTTVANGTHNRNGVGSVSLGNGSSYAGASFATALASKPLIDAANAALPGVPVADAERCFSAADPSGANTLDPVKVAGKIVLCKRGVTALVNKTGAVAAAGGAGAIIYNDPAGGTNTLALMHVVPTVHVVAANGLAIKSYIASAGAAATAAIGQSQIIFNSPSPLTAASSSRGPLQAGNGDLLKPDLIAPGSDILAAVAPPGNNGRLFDLYTGTSMSSPHVAGLAAVLKGIHPDWSPMMIKSALMTTGTDVLDGPNTNPAVIFRQGAGHVKPNSAVNPGLVFDSSAADWISFICGVQPGGGCAGVTPMDASNLNVASIAIGDLAGTQTVTRTLTNVGARSTYNFSAAGLAGFSVAVSPASFTLNPGQSQNVRITITRTTAALNAYSGGQLTWSDGLHSVRIPAVVRPLALAAPTQVSGSYSVTFGYAGPFTATARGLVPAAVTAGTVSQDPDQIFDPTKSEGTVAVQVSVPAGSTYARFSLFDADVAAGSDMDMYVYDSVGALVGSSASGTSAEEVNLLNPAAGNYTVYVHGWGLPSGSSSFKLNAWVLGSADAGNMTVTAPASATIGGTGAIGLGFTGLAAGTKYLGSVVYGGTAGMPSPTIVRKDGP